MTKVNNKVIEKNDNKIDTVKEKENVNNNSKNEIMISPKIMYVLSKEGLRIRSKASLESNKAGLLLYGESIIVNSRTNDVETIDGIKDYWYSFGKEKKSWIFGVYLS